MDITRLNSQLEWRDIVILPQYDAVGNLPFKGQIHFLQPELGRFSLSDQFKTACSNSGVPTDFIFIKEGETTDRLLGTFFPTEWLHEKQSAWYAFSRYLSFLIAPMEPETQPKDQMTQSYWVMQQSSLMTKGAEQSRLVEQTLNDLFLTARSTPLIEEEQMRSGYAEWLHAPAVDEAMRFCIKHLPEYSGSDMETLGESIWKEWEETKKELSLSTLQTDG